MEFLTNLVNSAVRETVKQHDTGTGFNFDVLNSDDELINIDVKIELSGLSCWPSIRIMVKPVGADRPLIFHDSRIGDNERQAIDLAIQSLGRFEYRANELKLSQTRKQAKNILSEFL